MDFELVLWQALAVLAAMLAAWFVWQGLTGLWVARPSPLAALPDNLAGDLDHEADRLHALERLPLLERLVGPPLMALGRRLFGRASAAEVEARLRRSGWVFLSVGDLYGSKLGLALLGGLAGTAVTLALGAAAHTVAVAALALGALGLIGPDWLVWRTIETRRLNVLREMSWTMDRLATIMVTGQTIQPALARMTSDEYTWLSAGRGGLFMALLRDLAVGLMSGESDRDDFFDTLRAAFPEGLPELDEFLHIVEVHHRRGAAVVEQLRGLGRALRDGQNNRILAAENAAQITLALMTSTVILPGFLFSIVGPLILKMVAFMSGS